MSVIHVLFLTFEKKQLKKMHFSDIRNTRKIKYNFTCINKYQSICRVFIELIIKTNYQEKYLQYLSILYTAIIHLFSIQECMNVYLCRDICYS